MCRWSDNRRHKNKRIWYEHDNENIAFGDLNIKNKEVLYKPLTKFRLFTQYLNESLEKAQNVSRWTKSNIKLVSKHKQSPCDSDYFKSTEYDNQIVIFNNHFIDGLMNCPKINLLSILLKPLYHFIYTEN
jgi:hypothetical protein